LLRNGSALASTRASARSPKRRFDSSSDATSVVTRFGRSLLLSFAEDGAYVDPSDDEFEQAVQARALVHSVE